MQVLRAVGGRLEPPLTEREQRAARETICKSIRKRLTLPQPFLELCAVRDARPLSAAKLIEVYDEVRALQPSSLPLPPVSVSHFDRAFTTLWCPVVSHDELAGPSQRDRCSSRHAPVFAEVYVIFAPSGAFTAAQAAKQLENVRANGGGEGRVLSRSDPFPLVIDRGTVGRRRVYVVCSDAEYAVRAVFPIDVPQITLCTPGFVPHSLRDKYIKTSRAYVFERIGEEADVDARPPSPHPPTTASPALPLCPSRLLPPSAHAPSSPTERAHKRARTSAPPSALACQSAFTRDELATRFPNNALIVENLSVLHALYVRQFGATHHAAHMFRVRGYERAIAGVRRLRHDLVCADDVDVLARGRGDGGDGAPWLGVRLRDKVREVVLTGRLREVDEAVRAPGNEAMRALCGVWGVGPAVAAHLVAAGVRSVAELRTRVRTEPGLLDAQQRIGLRYYEELRERIPREEVAEVGRVVRRWVEEVGKGAVRVVIAGSYIRGKEVCGDVDCLLVGRAKVVRLVLRKAVDGLAREGILRDHLVIGADKYFGVCRLAEGMAHRRLDLFAVPEEEFGFALLTYTGSGVFNRSMRLHARRMGYSLSHKGLTRVARAGRGAGAALRGESVACADERAIFDVLGLAYKEPWERDV